MVEPTTLIAQPTLDPRIPAAGSVPLAEWTFRVNWVTHELRSPGGVPMLSPDVVSRQGRAVRLIDVREAGEFVGPLGYIPGVDWVPADEALNLCDQVNPDEPIVLISRMGERAGELAKELEQRGLRFVATMMGGMVAWKDLGFYTSRDPAILRRRWALRPYAPRWEAQKGSLSLEEVEAHVGDPISIRWVKMAALMVHGRLSCVDGRDDTGVMGTPGGDMGDFLLAVAVVEKLTGKRLTSRVLETLLLRRFDAFGRFYMHSDDHAASRLLESFRQDKRMNRALASVNDTLGWRKLLLDPPPEVREVMLDHMVRPEHLGCGHLRLALQQAPEFGTRPELVKDLLRTYFRVRWNGSPEAELVELPGGHAEGAVVNVYVSEELAPFSWVPLVSPSAGQSQMFVCHPQVSAFLKRQLAEFFSRQGDLFTLPRGGAEILYAEMSFLAQTQAGQTLGALAQGLPVYHITFRPDMSVTVRPAGTVAPPSPQS